MLATHSGATPARSSAHVMADVRRFADGAKQSDDITVLAARYQPQHGHVQ